MKPMPMIAYTEQRFSGKSQKMIKAANEIIAEYAAQGYDLTLRQRPISLARGFFLAP